jgi:hypothetical protein
MKTAFSGIMDGKRNQKAPQENPQAQEAEDASQTATQAEIVQPRGGDGGSAR